jgi:hypothetical protein
VEKQPATKETPPTLEGFIREFEAARNQAYRTFLDEDDDLMGKSCDQLRMNLLPKALELAQTKKQCLQILDLTTSRNTELRAQIQAKMGSFKV